MLRGFRRGIIASTRSLEKYDVTASTVERHEYSFLEIGFSGIIFCSFSKTSSSMLPVTIYHVCNKAVTIENRLRYRRRSRSDS